MADDFDSPWKEALDFYFEPFLALLFPNVHAQIDWSRGHESLDKEFQQVVRDAETGRKYVDKLVKVFAFNGPDIWVLVHVEVQSDRDPEFPLRMFIYNHRVADRYNRPVASLAVLADDDLVWRPSGHRVSLFGCDVSIRFLTAKLLDFRPRMSDLETDRNPFAKVVLAHLKAKQTQGSPYKRGRWKLRIVRGLYEQGFHAKDVRELFRIIDWFLALPPLFEENFWTELEQIQEEKKMPYITSVERVGERRGMRMGIRAMLEMRFGESGLKLMPEIEQIHEQEMLIEIINALATIPSLDELRRIWRSNTPS